MFALLDSGSAPLSAPPDRTFSATDSARVYVATIGVTGAGAGAILITVSVAASSRARVASSARAASRSSAIRSRSAASFSTPSPITSAPTFAPAKSAAKRLRTAFSARMRPIPVRIPAHATNAPIPVRRLAAPPPAMFPIRPPWVGARISMRARTPTNARSERPMRNGTRDAVAERRSIHTANTIKATGTNQRPAPNQGASTSRSTSARAPRPGRIRPTAKITPVTAKASEISVRSADRDARGVRRVPRPVVSPPRFAIP